MLKEHSNPDVYNIHQSLIESELITDVNVQECSSNFKYDNNKRHGSDFKRVPFQCHLHKVCPICKIKQQKEYRQLDWKDHRLLMDSFDNPSVIFLTLSMKTRPNNNLQNDIFVLNQCFNNLC